MDLLGPGDAEEAAEAVTSNMETAQECREDPGVRHL